MTTPQNGPTTIPREMLFLQGAMARYQIVKNEQRLELPKEMEAAFLGETSVDYPQAESPSSGFFWQRLATYVNDKEPLYYRLKVAKEELTDPLSTLAEREDLLLFWLRIQFEAHQLIEAPLACAVTKEGVHKIPTDSLLGVSSEGAKIYFTPAQLEERLALLKGAMGDLLGDQTKSIQHTMGETLRDELARIREYYSHLLAKTQKTEEKDRLKHEQRTLEQEHIRKLHPNALKIVLVPELIASLTLA